MNKVSERERSVLTVAGGGDDDDKPDEADEEDMLLRLVTEQIWLGRRGEESDEQNVKGDEKAMLHRSPAKPILVSMLL